MDTFVQLSRDEFEDWLNSASLSNPWCRGPGVSIYYIKLSERVAVKISSTVNSFDQTMGKGEASVHLCLVALDENSSEKRWPLNRKAVGQNHFNRTTNWKTTWAIGVKRLIEAYNECPWFYEARANPEHYKDSVLTFIESLPNWKEIKILTDFYSKVFDNKVLSCKQTQLLFSMNEKDK